MNAVKNLSDLLGQIQQNLKCSICLELLSNPVTTRCRHNFCSFCISKFLNTKREVPCPLCKMSITKRSLHTSSELTVVIEGVRRLITAFEDDTGTTSSPAKGVGHSLQQGGVSSTKKTVGRASDSKCRSGNRSNRTDTAGCSTMASTSSSATTFEETALRSSDMTCEDSDCLEMVDGNSIRTGLSSPGDTENGSNGANSCKVRTSSRRALLRYLEEGAISHPDVSNASKSVCAVDEGDGKAIEGKRKPSRDKESKTTGHGVRNVCVEAVTSHFDNEVKPSVEKEQVGRRRQSVHIALNEQSSDSTAMKVHDYTGRETRGGNVGYRNRTKERKMDEVVVPPSEGANERNDGMNQKDENDSRTGHTTAGYDSNKVLKRTRSTSNNRTGRKREGLIGGDDDGKCTEEKGSDLTGCQVRLDKKTLSVHPGRTRITSDAALSNDVDHDEEKTQARCQGRKKKQNRNCHESENECNGRTEYSGISNVDVRGRDMSSPLSVCSISSTQQLQKSIQPVSRTYSKKMKAAFKESDDNVKWAHTKPTTIHGLNGHAELDPVTNSHDDGASFSSSPRDEKTIKIPPRSIQCQTDEEKQVQADHVDKSEICLSNVACINKNVSQNTVTTGSTTRKNSIFKSKNLSQGQSKSNGPSALSTSDQYEFQGGGTPPTLCDRRERRQKRVSGRKEKNKVMLALDGLEPRTSTRTTLSSCLKKGVVVEQGKECQRVESACDASDTSINLHKRVHFAGAGEHDKVTECPGKQRDSDVKMQEESGRAKVINIDDENSGVQAVVIDDANQVVQPENIDNDNINLEKDSGHRGMRECKKVENEMRKRHRDNAETTKGKDEMSAETQSGLLFKSTPVIHSRGRQRVRRRRAASVVEVNKEREVELEKMRSKIHEAEDFEFMFSTQEAHQHIANVNKQDDEKIKNRDFQTAFGFESLEELEDDNEKEICESDRRVVSCAVTADVMKEDCAIIADDVKGDCAMASDAVNSNVVGENETTNPGMAENNREHCHGSTSLEKKRGRNFRSAVCEGKQENQTIGCNDGGNPGARVKSKGADSHFDVKGHREPHSHVMKKDTSHIVNESNKEGESDVASVSMLQMRSGSSSIKSTEIGIEARAWHPSRKQAAMTHRFARPDVSRMRLFRPDTQLAGTGMFTSGSQCAIRDDVGSSVLKLNPETQSTKAVIVDSPSPKVVVETPLSSPLCLSDTNVIKSTNQTVRQAHPLSESPLQSKYKSAKHTTEGELGRETVRKCDLEGPLKTRVRGTERLTLTLNGSKLQTDEGAVQDRGGVEGGNNVEESEDLVTGSAIIAKDTCVDEMDDGEPTQKVCDVIIPDTEFPDAVYLSNSDDAEGHDSGGGEDRDDVQGNWQPGLITQEIGSPSPLSEVKTSKQATESSQNNNDATINVKSSVNVDDKSTKKTVSGRHSHVKCAMGSLDRRSVKDSQSVHLTGSNNTAGADCGDLHDMSNAESQDVAISSTYTVNHQCPKSDEEGEELVAGRMNEGSMCDDTMAGGQRTGLKSFDYNKQDNDACQSKSHDPGRTHTDQNQTQGEDVSETKTNNVIVSPDANCVLACMESESSQSIFSTTCQSSKSNHGRCRQQDQTINTQHHTQSPQTLERNSQTANMYDTQNINICSDGDNKVADELEFDENFEMLFESESKTDKQVLSNTPVTKSKGSVDNQKMAQSSKTPALTSSVSKYENCDDEGGVGTRSGRKRHSAGSVLKNQGGRNKKIKTESQQGVRGSAPARLLNIDFFCDSDDENDGVLIVRRSKRKCLSLDSVPLQPIVFGSDLVNEPASDCDKHDALTTMTSSSTPKKAFVNDAADNINNKDSISNIALNASACNTSEKSVVQETAESTIPPTMDENQDEGDSATNGTPSSDVDNTAATVLTRKTRRGFARKDNAFHKKPLVSLPDSVLPQNVKAAILKEFTSQSGEESNKSLDGCGEKGKTPVSEFGQEKSCQLSDENSKESQNIDTTSVGESNLSEESSQQVLDNESPKSKPGTVTGQTCEGNLETSTRAILSSTTKTLAFENTATTGTVDDKAILISSQQSPSQGETHQGSKPSDEDKKRLENELFGELPQNEPATDTDSELEDIHLNIQLTPSGGSASSQGSSQGSWCTPNVTEKLSNLPVKVSAPTDDVFDGNGEACSDGDDAVASESEEMIMPTKKRKRRMITSDSEDHGDTDSDLTNNNSEINNTSSSALSSQSEVISTQQRDALEREVQELQQKIAMCEAALNGSSREEKASSSSNPASNAENDDAVETTPEPIAKGGAEYGDDGDKSIMNENDEEGMVSDNDDLFILPPSPSPPEKPPSRPPPVSSRPALSSSSGIASKTSNDFVKRFKSPGGSLHKRRPLFDFTRVSDSAEMSQTAEWDRKNVENEQDQIVIDDSQNDCDIDEGATVEMEAQPELENDNSFDGSQSPVIFSLGSKDRKKASSHSSQDVMPPSNKKNCVIVASGLNGQELQLVHKLTNTLPNVRLGNRVLTDVTHVIMKTAPGREMVCDRTLKYFQAIARRLWIVSLQWITASLQAGELLPERDFEIQGDTSGGDRTQGPERARLSKQKIFDNYCFACFGNSPELPRDNMEELLTLCGASFVQDLIALPSSTCDNKIIICCTDVDLTSIEKAMLKGVYESTGVVSVKRDWVLDSVSSYNIFPLDDYLLLTNKV